MNDAHWHLVVNHFPIIGTIIGLGIILFGLIRKNKTIVNVAYTLFIVVSLFGFAAMNTGEGAEEMVEELPNVGHQVIHVHEEIAEKLAVILYVLGAVSIIGLWMNMKQHKKSIIVTYFATFVAIIAVFLAKEVGTTGGEIRHTEIRKGNAAVTENTTAESHVEDED